jgi:hypothetical protein
MRLFSKLEEWFEKREQAQFERNFKKLMEKKDSYQAKSVQAYALTLARGMVRNWLHKHNINHCFYCEETAPLRKLDGKYVCGNHFAALLKEKEIATKEEKREPVLV